MTVEVMMKKADSRKADGINKLFELHNLFSQKILKRAVFLLAPASKMLRTSRFHIGCLIWQHAVLLELICETNSTLILLSAERDGLLTPLLTCFAFFFFSPLLGQFIPSPSAFLLFTLSDKLILNPIFRHSLRRTN